MNEINNSNVNFASPPGHPFTSAPRPRLAFRVGVVGHRPNRLKKADIELLKDVLKSILEAIKEEVYSINDANKDFFDKPILRAISPLAEGTDRLFAELALDLEYELCCVMPFPQVEFEKDFAPGNALEPESLERFRSLLARAEKESKLTRFELDGSRENQGKAYGTGGRVILNQSDLLIVVWDGEIQGKIGGTEETFREARDRGVPVVLVDACAPHSWQILKSGDSLPDAAEGQRVSPNGFGTAKNLKKLVKNALDLPAPSYLEEAGNLKKLDSGRRRNDDKSFFPGISNFFKNCLNFFKFRPTENIKDHLMDFYKEGQPKVTISVVWKIFRDIFGDSKLPDVNLNVKPFEEAVINDWPKDSSTAFKRTVNWLRPYYAWPDKLAVIYSDRYRSAFILAFLLAAIAVGLALAPMGFSLAKHSLLETSLIKLEFMVISVIIILILWGRHRRWHERWIDYRLAAELVRHLRLVVSLGGGRPFPQIPAHWATYGQPGASWMAWYVRAVERALGLPSVVVDKNHLDECLSDLLKLVTDQIKYHKTTAERCQRIEHRLHISGIYLLIFTLIACLLHVFNVPAWISNLLTLLCGFFPALGAALAGIINQGEFLRISKRSSSMQKQLQRLLGQINDLKDQINAAGGSSDQQFSTKAVHLAGDAAHLMVYEVLDWRVVFLDRPLHPPA